LSSAVDFSGHAYKSVTAELLRETLDALGVDRARVVGGSIGNLWALRLAQAQPSRVERLVLLGAGPLTSEIGVPPFIRLLRSPLGRSSPASRITRGCWASSLPGWACRQPRSRPVPDAFIDWHVAMSRETDWARHERDMVKRIVVVEATCRAWCSRTPRSPGSSHPPSWSMARRIRSGRSTSGDGSSASWRGASWR
jgi:pimeloyl-ACP methyl ester carboxylesterase